MAVYKQKYNVGDFVYEPYSPQRPGKVMRIVGAGSTTIDIDGGVGTIPPLVLSSNDYVEVKFLNGKTKQISMMHLADFNALIADHQKKLQTHQSKLSKLAAL